MLTIEQQIHELKTSQHSFSGALEKSAGSARLGAISIGVFQVNVGKLCNQACRHCHVDAGPKRTEIMTRETMEQILQAIDLTPDVKTVDLTGGAPELNHHFQWFVKEIRQRKLQVIDRCNLTVLFEPGMEYLPEFLAEHQVEVVASLPHFAASRTDQQRGKGVFDKSVLALKKLNELGYAQKENLKLNLVYNPSGLFLSPNQQMLQSEYKTKLKSEFGIEFNNLYCINNMPINRFLQSLIKAEKYETYMEILVNAFNPATIEGLMCRHQVSIGWDGYIYDCDFNQMLEMKSNRITHIANWNADLYRNRDIVIENHCFGCTAGAGSSCGGELT